MSSSELNLLFYIHNVCGISFASQLSQVRAAILTCPYDIIVLIETWLNKNIQSSELFDPKEWIVFRCDKADVGDNRRDGGVLIAIRAHYMVTRVNVVNDSHIEQVWTELKFIDRSLFLGATYLPPSSSEETYDAAVQCVGEVADMMKNGDSIIYLGDLNRVVQWIPDSENPLLLRYTDADVSTAMFFDNLSELGLSQICDMKSRKQLDLILTDIESDFAVDRARHPLKNDSFHHVAIELSVALRADLPDEDPEETNFDFKNANLPAISSDVRRID